MKALQNATRGAALVVLASCSIGFADLANVSTYSGNAGSDALTRIAASKHFEGANVAALDPGTDLQENFVYYSSFAQAPDLSAGAGGGGGGGGGGGFPWSNPGDNGVIGGGGGGGSGPTGNEDPGGEGDGRHTPSPGAALLALIGMACVGGARRRV